MIDDTPSPTDFGFTGQRQDGFGLIDYNARYYSQALGRFISPDMVIPNPSAPISFNRYAYTHNNPIKYQDPSGHAIETVWDVANIVIGVGSLGYNLYEGNYVDAAIDAGGLVIDVAATAIPFVPGGAGTAIKAVRTAGKVDDLMDAAKTLNTGSNIVQGVNQVETGLDVAKQVENTVDTANDLDNAADAAKQKNWLDRVNKGNRMHYDQLNGADGAYAPTQLRDMYPETDFQFARRGQAGPDATYRGGKHPSEYPNSTWPSGSNHADFKPNTPNGFETFYGEVRSGKLPSDTVPVPYDPDKMKILPEHAFSSPWP